MISLLEIYWQRIKQLRFIPLLHLLISIPFIFISIVYILSFFETRRGDLFYDFLFMLSAGISALVNFHVFCQTLFSKNSQKYYKSSFVILLLSSWPLFWFFSFLLPSSLPLMLFILPILILVIIFVFRRSIFSSWIVGSMAVIALIMVFYTNIGMFEESYCWKVGEEADPTRIGFVEPTEEERLEGYFKIGLAWRAHKNCHNNFNLFSAIKDELNFK